MLSLYVLQASRNACMGHYLYFSIPFLQPLLLLEAFPGSDCKPAVKDIENFQCYFLLQNFLSEKLRKAEPMTVASVIY